MHANFRDHAVIALLWSGLARYAAEHGAEYLMGCASISMADGGHVAASLYRKLVENHQGPIEWRAFPRHRLPIEALTDSLDAPIPPLIKGYLHAGALICGELAWDPDFDAADLLILMPLKSVNRRYAHRFLGEEKSIAA